MRVSDAGCDALATEGWEDMGGVANEQRLAPVPSIDYLCCKSGSGSE
jgi:hypothetical protein